MTIVQCDLSDACSFCTGEACHRCGAGCWSNRHDCEHDVIERHQAPEFTRIEDRYGVSGSWS